MQVLWGLSITNYQIIQVCPCQKEISCTYEAKHKGSKVYTLLNNLFCPHCIFSCRTTQHVCSKPVLYYDSCEFWLNYAAIYPEIHQYLLVITKIVMLQKHCFRLLSCPFNIAVSDKSKSEHECWPTVLILRNSL